MWKQADETPDILREADCTKTSPERKVSWKPVPPLLESKDYCTGSSWQT